MMFKFSGLRNPKEKSCAGLDIGTASTKLVKLKFSQAEAQLCGFVLQPNTREAGQALGQLARAQNISAANISLSGPSTLIRYINFPKMNYSELQQALKFEAQKHIPFAVEEVVLDACILKDSLPENKMLVLLAAVKKELVQARLKAMEEAGIKPALIDMDSLALMNCFNFNYPQQNGTPRKVIALVNIGASMTNVNILEDGIPRLSRDIHIAGTFFTQKLADIFSVDFNAAERMKLNPDPDKANKIAAAMESALTGLSAEIRTSFDFYESQSAMAVEKIYLSGGACASPRTREILAESLGIEVELWDPFKRIGLAKDIDAAGLKQASMQLAVAVGLALRK